MSSDLSPFDYEGSTRVRAQAFLDQLGISEISYPEIVDDAVRHATDHPAVPADQPWVPIGPRNVGGRITALAQDPKNTLTIYAGSAHGGLWRTLDGGDTWEHLGKDEHNFPISAIAVPEQAPNIVYVGSGSADPSYAAGRGIYQVTIPNLTSPAVFRRMTTPDPPSIAPSAATNGAALRYTRIRMDPYDARRFWAASQSGLWRCEVGAAPGTGVFTRDFPAALASGTAPAVPAARAWASGPYPSYATDVLVSRDPRVTELVGGIPKYLLIFVAIDGVGVFRGRFDRTTRTTAWDAQCNVPNPAIPPFGRVRLAQCRRRPQRVYALMSNTPNFAGPPDAPTAVYHSDNTGDSWSVGSNLMPTGGQANYDLLLECSPENPDIVIAGSLNIYMSQDRGNNWTQILEWRDLNNLGDYAQHADQHAGMFDGGDRRMFWAGNDGGLVLATDLRRPPLSAGFWRMRSHGIAAGQLQDVTTSPAFPFMTGAGFQDNGSWLSFGGPTWMHIGWADGGYVSVDGANPRRYFVSQQNAHTTYTPAPIAPQPNIYNPVLFDLPVSLVPDHAMGLNNAVLGGLVGAAANSPFVPVLEQHPVNPGQLILGWQQGGAGAAAHSSIDGGATAAPPLVSALGGPLAFPGGVQTTTACFGPVIPGVATVEGWIGLSNGTLFRTNNAPAGGWAPPATALPWPGGVVQIVSRVVVHPTDERIIAVASAGTVGRVFLSYDRGTSWQDITERVPASVAVTPATPSIAVGQIIQLTATATYPGGATLNVTARATWASANVAQASMSTTGGQEGQCTGVAATAAVAITATVGAVSGSTNVTVTAGPAPAAAALGRPPRPSDLPSLPPCPMASLAFDPGAPTNLYVGTLAGVYVLANIPSPTALRVNPNPAPGRLDVANGTTVQVNALLRFTGGGELDVTTETDWSVAPPGIVTLGATAATAGHVRGTAAGNATITVRRGTLTTTLLVRVPGGAAPAAPPVPGPPAAAVAPIVAINWRPFNNKLPLTLINDLTIVPQTRVLRAATFGRGAWDCDLAGLRPAHRLFIRQTIIEGSQTDRTLPPAIPDDPRLPALAVALDQTHAFDIRVESRPFTSTEDRVDGVEFDERLRADSVTPHEKCAVYVQVHNDGAQPVGTPVAGAELHLYFQFCGPAPIGPAAAPIPALAPVTDFYVAGFEPIAAAQWQRVGPKQTLPPIKPGEPVVARFDWVPPPPPIPPAVPVPPPALSDVALLALVTGPAGQDALPAAPVAGPGLTAFLQKERRAALRIVHVEAPAKADLFIRDGVSSGEPGLVSFAARSPDILCVQEAPTVAPEVFFRDLLDPRPQDKLVAGAQNFLYVRVHNRGQAPTLVDVELWTIKIKDDGSPDFGAAWQRLGTASLIPVPRRSWVLAPITWTPTPADDPTPADVYKAYLLVALINSTDTTDPLPDVASIGTLDTFWDILGRAVRSNNAAARAYRYQT